MAARKTIKVTSILRMGNHFLKESDDSAIDERQATANFMESILHHADAYAGFQYLDSAGVDHDGWNAAWDRHRAVVEIRKAMKINYNNDQPRWENYCKDDTRRVYLTHKNLR